MSRLQSKRELFFKSELPNANSGGTVTANMTTVAAPSVLGQPPQPPDSKPPPPSNKDVVTALLAKREAAAAAAAAAATTNHTENKENRFRERDKDEKQQVRKPQPATKQLDGYVGFASLPNQVYRKAVKRGFDFTLMVVGESGLGKSTLVNSMFLSDIYSNQYPGPSERVAKTVRVDTTRVLLKENGVNLTLTVVDTPGFGDAVDNSNCWQPVLDYVEARYEEYLNHESRVTRQAPAAVVATATTQPQPPLDGRVHCCLYFIAPSGHGLKPLDVEFMQRLHDRVNIVPVLAKADTMTPEECTAFKKQILQEIHQHKIKIYEFPDSPEEDEEAKQNAKLKARVPFAVVGSNTVLEMEGGKRVRGRRYPWGVAEVENLEHCDFLALRNMLLRTHLQDLKEITGSVHYENFRCRKLATLGTAEGNKSTLSNVNPLAQMEDEKREHEAKMKKMEAEMEQVFKMKVSEKKQKLKDSETDLQRRHEQMRKSLEQQQKELEERRSQFEKERLAWEQSTGVTIEELRRRSLEANSKETVDGKDKKKKKGLF
ncbi:septin-7 isoform X2 [Neocloeon triangulifer]|uniref:septin-7 isoform X2 n=1 Tax=Neocloeon triangulifer TaxID=2078957 RepID=UPI00286F48D6|nr:septin-7 isoform X2 [Neocloeon triangulifer]XP_059477364.1 septin-7 isoform X2 [Neocloeon triangulifer]